MARYFIYFSYDGTNYHGWQIQPNAHTVQAELDKALSTLLREKIVTTGAGRTDAGVHASMMVAHFDVSNTFDAASLAGRLNRMLPADIAVSQIRHVGDDAHARFDARWRTYHYYVYREKSPFRRHYALRCTFPLDFGRMNEAAACLLGTHDFTSFSKVHTDVKTHRCTLTQARWEETEPGLWRFEITADRFLRGMVRAIVGTLIDVGRGRISPEDFAAILEAHNRAAASDSAAPEALFLVDIAY